MFFILSSLNLYQISAAHSSSSPVSITYTYRNVLRI
jgi:hypothetical protein